MCHCGDQNQEKIVQGCYFHYFRHPGWQVTFYIHFSAGHFLTFSVNTEFKTDNDIQESLFIHIFRLHKYLYIIDSVCVPVNHLIIRLGPKGFCGDCKAYLLVYVI